MLPYTLPYLTWQTVSYWCQRVKDLERGDDPGLSGGPSVSTRVFIRGRQEGQRKGKEASQKQES